jgi:AraC-like DNA-binding protein
MELLKKNAGTVSEIAYMVGFGKPSNFAKWFQEQFGVLPSSIRKDMIGENESRHT